MNVQFEYLGNEVHLKSHYVPDFPTIARRLGGRWNGNAWVFSRNHLNAVRNACLDIYGEDGRPQPFYSVDVRYNSQVAERQKQFFDLGRMIIGRFRRDSGILPGPKVSILEGEFSNSGGSAKNPTIGIILSPTFTCSVGDVPKYILDHWSEFSCGQLLRVYDPQSSTTDAILNQIAALVYQLPPEVAEPFLPLLPQHQDTLSLVNNYIGSSILETLALLQDLQKHTANRSPRFVVKYSKGSLEVQGDDPSLFGLIEKIVKACHIAEGESYGVQLRAGDGFVYADVYRGSLSDSDKVTLRLIP